MASLMPRAFDQRAQQAQVVFEFGGQSARARLAVDHRHQPQAEARAHEVAGFLVRQDLLHRAAHAAAGLLQLQAGEFEDRVLRQRMFDAGRDELADLLFGLVEVVRLDQRHREHEGRVRGLLDALVFGEEVAVERHRLIAEALAQQFVPDGVGRHHQRAAPAFDHQAADQGLRIPGRDRDLRPGGGTQRIEVAHHQRFLVVDGQAQPRADRLDHDQVRMGIVAATGLGAGGALMAEWAHGQEAGVDGLAVGARDRHPFALVGAEAELVAMVRRFAAHEDPEFRALDQVEIERQAQILAGGHAERIDLEPIAAEEHAAEFGVVDLADLFAVQRGRRQRERPRIAGGAEIPQPDRLPGFLAFAREALAFEFGIRRGQLREQAAQFARKRFAVVEALLRVDGECAVGDLAQRRGHLRPVGLQRRALAFAHAFDQVRQLFAGLGFAGRVQRQQFVEDDPERIDVGALVGVAGVAARLFRRHVGGRAEDLPVLGLAPEALGRAGVGHPGFGDRAQARIGTRQMRRAVAAGGVAAGVGAMVEHRQGRRRRGGAGFPIAGALPIGGGIVDDRAGVGGGLVGRLVVRAHGAGSVPGHDQGGGALGGLLRFEEVVVVLLDARRLFAQRPRQAPVEDPHLAEVPDHDVGRFEIAVDDALAVGIAHDFQKFQEQRQAIDQRQFAPMLRRRLQLVQTPVHGLAAREGHDVAQRLVRRLRRFEDRDDARVVQAGCVADLEIEAGGDLAVIGQTLVEDLDRDLAFEVAVPGHVHAAGDTTTDFTHQGIAPGNEGLFADVGHTRRPPYASTGVIAMPPQDQGHRDQRGR